MSANPKQMRTQLLNTPEDSTELRNLIIIVHQLHAQVA